VKRESVFFIVEGQCAGPAVCPLSRVRPGSTVCIKSLATQPEIKDRLRELGFIEEQQIKLVSSDSNYICQVCNARLGISQKLAEAIWVEAVPAKPEPQRARRVVACAVESGTNHRPRRERDSLR
jgi:Fe2+ transport system protein FeoA